MAANSAMLVHALLSPNKDRSKISRAIRLKSIPKSEKHSWLMSASLTKLLSSQKFSEGIIPMIKIKTKRKDQLLQIILNKPQSHLKTNHPPRSTICEIWLRFVGYWYEKLNDGFFVGFGKIKFWYMYDWPKCLYLFLHQPQCKHLVLVCCVPSTHLRIGLH